MTLCGTIQITYFIKTTFRHHYTVHEQNLIAYTYLKMYGHINFLNQCLHFIQQVQC